MKSGFYWHVYHSELLTWCYDYDERAKYIKKYKPEHERAIRLALMQPVKGKLPEDLIKTGEVYVKARNIYIRLDRLSDVDRNANKTNRARKKFDEAWRIFREAIKNNLPYLKKLHSKECPDCCWNGKELVFPDEE